MDFELHLVRLKFAIAQVMVSVNDESCRFSGDDLGRPLWPLWPHVICNFSDFSTCNWFLGPKIIQLKPAFETPVRNLVL